MAKLIVQQSQLFLISMFYGGILGIWYDFFRAIRKQISHKNKMVHMEDIIFCISAAAGLFLLFQVYNQGKIRNYILIGVFVGALIYFFLLSKFVGKGMQILIKIILKFLKIVSGGIFLPVKIVVNSLVKSLKKIYRTVKIIKSKK